MGILAEEAVVGLSSRRSFWLLVIRVVWGILGVPAALVLFLFLLTLLFFPVGGGVNHLLFAHSPGGNLQGARVVFAGMFAATAVATIFLRVSRYPFGWLGPAIVTSIIALRSWLAPLDASLAGPSFRVQGYLLAPLLPAVAFGISYYSERRMRRRKA